MAGGSGGGGCGHGAAGGNGTTVASPGGGGPSCYCWTPPATLVLGASKSWSRRIPGGLLAAGVVEAPGTSRWRWWW